MCRIIPGVPLSMSFDPSSSNFSLSLSVDPSLGDLILYANRNRHYPNGLRFTASPLGAVGAWNYTGNALVVSWGGGVSGGDTVTMSVSRT